MRLPDGVDDREVAGAALERNIVDRPLSGYYADPLRTSAGLLLGYACVPDGEIAGVRHAHRYHRRAAAASLVTVIGCAARNAWHCEFPRQPIGLPVARVNNYSTSFLAGYIEFANTYIHSYNFISQ